MRQSGNRMQKWQSGKGLWQSGKSLIARQHWEFLGLGLAILALALYIGLRKTDRIRYRLPEIGKVDAETIDRMTIESGDSSLSLEHRDGRWIILPEGHAADPGASSDMVRAVADLRISDLVSTSGDLNRYGLDETQRIKVSAYGGDEQLRSVSIGKSTGRSTFIGLENDKRVFSAPTNLRSLFQRDREALRDRQVLSFSPETISEIDVADEGGPRKLVRAVVPDDEEGQITVWKTEGGEELDVERMEEAVRRLSALRCIRYLSRDEPHGIPVTVIQLKGAEVYRLSIYPAGDDGYPAESSAAPDPFLVSKWIVDDLREAFSAAGAPSTAEPSPPDDGSSG